MIDIKLEHTRGPLGEYFVDMSADRIDVTDDLMDQFNNGYKEILKNVEKDAHTQLLSKQAKKILQLENTLRSREGEEQNKHVDLVRANGRLQKILAEEENNNEKLIEECGNLLEEREILTQKLKQAHDSLRAVAGDVEALEEQLQGAKFIIELLCPRAN